MKQGTKIILIILAGLVISWTGLRIMGLKFFKIPTASMENTVPVGTRIMVWKKNFHPERFEIIVYHNPDFDTVLVPHNPMGYYAAKRQMGSTAIDSRYQKVFVPLAKREQWLGRCVGIPGDKIEIRNGKLLVNSEIYNNSNVKKMYTIKTKDNKLINRKWFEKNQIKSENIFKQADSYILSATTLQISDLKNSVPIDTSYCMIEPVNRFDNMIFPFKSAIQWNRDNFGELMIPKKGVEINLTTENIDIYWRLIETFEENVLYIQDSKIMINGKITDTYTPKQDYYFICNDNRDNSLDSRYYGFLPKDHISGKVLKIFN